MQSPCSATPTACIHAVCSDWPFGSANAAASTVCKMMDRLGGVSKLNGFYGSNPDLGILMDNVECATVYETSLNQCTFTLGHNCQHSQDAGVECGPPGTHGGTLSQVAFLPHSAP